MTMLLNYLEIPPAKNCAWHYNCMQTSCFRKMIVIKIE